jgi:hypothetical protein
MIISPMIIFTGVYGTKLMQQWEAFEDDKISSSLCFHILC